MRVSNAVNWRYWNKVATSGSASSSKPSIAGIPISKVVRKPQSSAPENAVRSVLT